MLLWFLIQNYLHITKIFESEKFTYLWLINQLIHICIQQMYDLLYIYMCTYTLYNDSHPLVSRSLQILKSSGARQWCSICIKTMHALLCAQNGLQVMGDTSYNASAVSMVVMPYHSQNNDNRKLCTYSAHAFFKVSYSMFFCLFAFFI